MQDNTKDFNINVSVRVDPEENFLPTDGKNEEAVEDIIRNLLYDVDGLVVDKLEVIEK